MKYSCKILRKMCHKKNLQIKEKNPFDIRNLQKNTDDDNKKSVSGTLPSTHRCCETHPYPPNTRLNAAIAVESSPATDTQTFPSL